MNRVSARSGFTGNISTEADCEAQRLTEYTDDTPPGQPPATRRPSTGLRVRVAEELERSRLENEFEAAFGERAHLMPSPGLGLPKIGNLYDMTLCVNLMPHA